MGGREREKGKEKGKEREEKVREGGEREDREGCRAYGVPGSDLSTLHTVLFTSKIGGQNYTVIPSLLMGKQELQGHMVRAQYKEDTDPGGHPRCVHLNASAPPLASPPRTRVGGVAVPIVQIK